MGKAKLNIPMCAALVLLLLTMVSIHLTSGLYARYTTNSYDTDSARVAKFDVTAAVDPVQDQEGVFTLTVTNNSEVAVEYQVVVTISNHLNAVIVNETNVKKTVESATERSVITFENSQWVMGPNAGAQTHTLQLTMVNWVGVTSGKDSGATEEVPFEFEVAVTATQID